MTEYFIHDIERMSMRDLTLHSLVNTAELQDRRIASGIETFLNFRKYGLPIFIILGLLGNCLSAIVLFRKKMRSFSSNIYLGVITISDIVYSTTLLIRWLELMDIKPNKNYLFWFKTFIVFLNYISEFLSVWLIVAFTIERYIVTKYPLLRRSWCTVKRAKIVVITLMGIAILRSILYILFHIMMNKIIEEKRKTNMFHAFEFIRFHHQKGIIRIKNIIDSIIIFTLPALVIVICNTLIGYHIYQQNRVRKTMITASDSSNERIKISNDKMLQRKITKMLILVSSTFVILKLPEYFFFYIFNNLMKYVNVLVMMLTFQLLDMAHCSINFVLYCATGQIFRRELIHLFTKRTNIKN
nr:PREDICTED: FMRFamide receptor-like isoform X2 [Linepithema humile]